MPDHAKTYAAEAERYERLIAREDYQQNILPAIRKICDPSGLGIADLGAGTGRLICMLAPFARHIWGFDASGHMLQMAESRLRAAGLRNWTLGVADHQAIPLSDASVDLVVGGWALCYASSRDGRDSTQKLDGAFAEIYRVLRPGGTVILLDTLGTGNEEPAPLPKLREYYDYLNRSGFSSEWIRTDYRFESVPEAVELTRFFFGDALAEKLEREQSRILPECTGVWWKRI
ncbi:MAG: class I SAM-dependent methyltransferase [Kiritimatiellia bacterium]